MVPPMTLNPQQKQQLKRAAHPLKPFVIIGQNGLTPAVISEINSTLEAHELIKVKIGGEDRLIRKQWLEALCEATQSEYLQLVGHIATIYRKRQKQTEPKITRRKQANRAKDGDSRRHALSKNSKPPRYR